MKKETLQNEELNNVSGGFDCNNQNTVCGNRNQSVDLSNASTQSVSDGCGGSAIIYKCPKCSAWIYATGEVYDN